MPAADTDTSSPSYYLLYYFSQKVRGVTSDLLDEPRKLQKGMKGEKGKDAKDKKGMM
jgi:hypothetical protein